MTSNNSCFLFCRYEGLLLACLGSSTLNYAIFGSLCYLSWGTDTKGNVLNNLQAYAHGNGIGEAAVTVVQASLVFCIAGSYPLQLFVFTDLFESWLFKPGRLSKENVVLKQNISRALLVLGTCLVAVAVPNFALLMGIIGKGFVSCLFSYTTSTPSKLNLL